MKNTTILVMMVLMIALVGGFVYVKGNNVNGNVVSGTEIQPTTQQGQIQKVVLSQDGYNYKDSIAEAGKPIAISADSSVGGCLRSVVFNIEGKKYSKYLKTPGETLELPALSKGTYPFSCSMGMGYGKLVVK